MREYEECYIAVIDLLGFKNIISSETCETIASFFDEIYNCYTVIYETNGLPIINFDEVNMKVASDTILFFINTSVKNSLAALIAICDYFQVRMMRLENIVLCRGGIVKGQIYSKDDVFFGPGINEAYLMEENDAKYPRIILTKSVMDSFNNYNEAGINYINQFVIKDMDGYYTLDYLYLFYGLNHEQDSWKKCVKYICDTLDFITNDSIKEKYQYIKDNLSRVTKKYLEFSKE